MEIPDRLFQEIKSYSGEERVSVARWIASATTQAAKGYREGFRFDHHGGKKVTDE